MSPQHAQMIVCVCASRSARAEPGACPELVLARPHAAHRAQDSGPARGTAHRPSSGCQGAWQAAWPRRACWGLEARDEASNDARPRGASKSAAGPPHARGSPSETAALAACRTWLLAMRTARPDATSSRASKTARSVPPGAAEFPVESGDAPQLTQPPSSQPAPAHRGCPVAPRVDERLAGSHMHSHCVEAPTRPHPAPSDAPALADRFQTEPDELVPSSMSCHPGRRGGASGCPQTSRHDRRCTFFAPDGVPPA